MHILFTRPEIDSVYSAKKFIQLGHQVSVFPILNIVKKKIIDINFTNYNSVVFTSSNAVLCLDQNIQSNVRCFCVGEATAVHLKKKDLIILLALQQNVCAAQRNDLKY